MARVPIACGAGPAVIVGGVIEHEVGAQADAGVAQRRGQCFEIRSIAQRRFDGVVVAHREAAVVVACAGLQERQQVQVADPQRLQIRHALGDAAQGAGESVDIGGVAQHVLGEEPAGVALAPVVQRAQRVRPRVGASGHAGEQPLQRGVGVRCIGVQRDETGDEPAAVRVPARAGLRTMGRQRRLCEATTMTVVVRGKGRDIHGDTIMWIRQFRVR